MPDALLGKQPAAAGLGAEDEEFRIRAIQRDAEAERQIALQVGGVVRNEMGPVRVRNQMTDALDEVWALEQLHGERARAAVLRRNEEQPGARVACDHARQQAEIILDGARQDSLRGDVDHAGARLAQQQQEEQEAFFVGLDGGALNFEFRRYRRNRNDRLFVLIQGSDRGPERNKLALQAVETARRFFRRNAELGQWQFGGRRHESWL